MNKALTPRRSQLDDVEQVVAEPLHFKAKLAIGENAYTSLRTVNRLRELWDVLAHQHRRCHRQVKPDRGHILRAVRAAGHAGDRGRRQLPSAGLRLRRLPPAVLLRHVPPAR